MKQTIDQKITDILSKKAEDISEADTQHLFTLLRKSIEHMRKSEARQYALVKFYSDWTLHIKLDRSAIASIVIRQVESTIKRHLKPNANNAKLPAELTQLLSFAELREQINKINEKYSAPIDDIKWDYIRRSLIEIIADCALVVKRPKISLRDRISKFFARQATQEKEAIVQEVAIQKLQMQQGQQPTDCMVITLSNTTKIVAPVVD